MKPTVFVKISNDDDEIKESSQEIHDSSLEKIRGTISDQMRTQSNGLLPSVQHLSSPVSALSRTGQRRRLCCRIGRRVAPSWMSSSILSGRGGLLLSAKNYAFGWTSIMQILILRPPTLTLTSGVPLMLLNWSIYPRWTRTGKVSNNPGKSYDDETKNPDSWPCCYVTVIFDNCAVNKTIRG